MSKIYFISFSGSVTEQDQSLAQRQILLHETAKQFGCIDEDIIWKRDDILESSFYKQNRAILNEERGAGFWSWKPYIILQTLKKIKKNDWVIYCDIGKPFRRGDKQRAGNFNIGNTLITPVNSIVDFANSQNGFTPGVWIPHYGLAHMWTKRDCFVGMSCDSEKYHYSPHVQAGYSAWSNSAASIKFLQEWLSWCQKKAIISDDVNIYGKPNLEGFKDHRHDQSILSNMTIRDKLELFGSKETSLSGYRNFNFILRHMALSNEGMQRKRKLFKSLFYNTKQELPKPLEEYLSLQFLTDLKENDSILIDSDMDVLQWQKAIPKSRIDLYSTKSNKLENNNSLKGNHYFGIFLLLVLGKYDFKDNNTIKEPLDSISFGELVRWIEINQRLPTDCGDLLDQRINALTLGNAVNPLQIKTSNTELACAVFIKPKSYLGGLAV